MLLKKKTLAGIISSVLLSSVLLVILFISSFDFSSQQGDFLRQFPKHVAIENDTVDIEYNSYYLAGAADRHVYLGNTTAPLRMLTVNTVTADTQHVVLNIEKVSEYKFWSVRVSVDSPYFYMTDGTIPAIFKGRVNDWHGRRFMYDSAHFTDAVAVSPWSFALRTVTRMGKEYILGKEEAGPPHVQTYPGLLEKQVDGRFCVDGKMHYSKAINRLVYLYFYRNQFIVMDSNLNLDYRGHTIDTVSRAQIRIDSVKSENSITMSAPPLIVNRQSCVSGNWLFVNSNLPAKNEVKDPFGKTSVIDVYDLANGAYKFSFYIDNFEKFKMNGFIVAGHKLVAMHSHYLVIYDLTAYYFKDTMATAFR